MVTFAAQVVIPFGTSISASYLSHIHLISPSNPIEFPSNPPHTTPPHTLRTESPLRIKAAPESIPSDAFYTLHIFPRKQTRHQPKGIRPRCSKTHDEEQRTS